jgi:hypothetical protein
MFWALSFLSFNTWIILPPTIGNSFQLKHMVFLACPKVDWGTVDVCVCRPLWHSKMTATVAMFDFDPRACV